MNKTFREQWLSNVTADMLAGTVVALALIPEAIAFSIIAGVDPSVGLYASFCIAVVTSLAGGRPGMISAATGAMALVVVPLVASHGLPYLLAATVLSGMMQLGFSAFKLARYIKFVPQAVMVGFVNSLAILIFLAQLPQLTGVTGVTYAMVAAGLAIIYLFPMFTKAVPSALVAIIVLTGLTLWFGWDVRTVGDMGELPKGLPFFALPEVPFTLDTLSIIFPYSVALSGVALIESLLTARIVDDRTDSRSNKHQVVRSLGLANIVAGLFGGMAGCALIGQSTINVASGGRTYLSTLWAGVLLLGLIVGLADLVAAIPMPVLVAVMIMVSISTFDWGSLRRVTVMPRSEVIVLLATMAVVIGTHDLSKGVLVGVILSAVFFARVVGKLVDVHSYVEEQTRIYSVRGQLFFVSVDSLLDAIDYNGDEDDVVIDLTHSHIWDATAVAAVDKAVLKLRERDKVVTLRGLDDASHTLVERLGEHHKPGAKRSVGH